MTTPFKYMRDDTGSEDFSYSNGKVLSVKFDISRYGKYKHTLVFPTQISVEDAIEKAEEYLSEPITEEYYNTVRDDLFCHEFTWEDVKNKNYCRGDLLSDAIFLESVNVSRRSGCVTLRCGS